MKIKDKIMIHQILAEAKEVTEAVDPNHLLVVLEIVCHQDKQKNIIKKDQKMRILITLLPQIMEIKRLFILMKIFMQLLLLG
jgi:hypothetical protein